MSMDDVSFAIEQFGSRAKERHDASVEHRFQTFAVRIAEPFFRLLSVPSKGRRHLSFPERRPCGDAFEHVEFGRITQGHSVVEKHVKRIIT